MNRRILFAKDSYQIRLPSIIVLVVAAAANDVARAAKYMPRGGLEGTCATWKFGAPNKCHVEALR